MVKPNVGHLAVLALCNNFYFNSLLNYKVIYILGVIFLIRRLQIRWIISLGFVFVMQLMMISLNSPQIRDDLTFFLLSTAQFIGMIGWIRAIIYYDAISLSPKLIAGFVLLSVLLPNSVLNIDIILASVFALFGVERRTGIFFDLFNLILSIVIAWRAATVAILAGIIHKIWMIPIKNLRIIMRFTILVCAVIAFISLTILANLILSLLISTGSGFDPTSGRLVMWLYSLDIWIEGLKSLRVESFFGYGFNYPAHMFSDINSINLKVSFLGLDLESTKITGEKSRLHLHNFILQMLIEFGLLYIAFQSWVIYKFYFSSAKIAIITTVGITAGLFTSVFYLYSPYFVLIYMIYLKSKRQQGKVM